MFVKIKALWHKDRQLDTDAGSVICARRADTGEVNIECRSFADRGDPIVDIFLEDSDAAVLLGQLSSVVSEG